MQGTKDLQASPSERRTVIENPEDTVSVVI